MHLHLIKMHLHLHWIQLLRISIWFRCWTFAFAFDSSLAFVFRCASPHLITSLVSRKTPESTILVQTVVRHITGSAYWACDTSRGRRTSVRHTTGSAYWACDTPRGGPTELTTHHGVGLLSVRHITRSAYWACDTPRGLPTERATHHGVGLLGVRYITGRCTSMRHITGYAYEKRTSGLDFRTTSRAWRFNAECGQRQLREGYVH